MRCSTAVWDGYCSTPSSARSAECFLKSSRRCCCSVGLSVRTAAGTRPRRSSSSEVWSVAFTSRA
eukprot:2379543-Rhodomonas_salina.1